jgi:hypothetical protein
VKTLETLNLIALVALAIVAGGHFHSPAKLSFLDRWEPVDSGVSCPMSRSHPGPASWDRYTWGRRFA